jgi:hypothetical protein
MTDHQHTAADVMETMAHMLNYLDVSLYLGQMTHQHQQSLARLNEIYATASKRPNVTPSIELIQEFYNTLVSLRSITETKDEQYCDYTRLLRQYIAAPVAAAAPPAAHYTPPTPASWYGDDSDDSDDSDGELEVDMMHRELSEWTDRIRRNKSY